MIVRFVFVLDRYCDISGQIPFCFTDQGLGVMVFNVTFNNISVFNFVERCRLNKMELSRLYHDSYLKQKWSSAAWVRMPGRHFYYLVYLSYRAMYMGK